MNTLDADDHAPEHSCPTYEWCESFNPEFAHNHEHYRQTMYVPATMSRPVLDIHGASYPTVGVGITYSEGLDDHPAVWVHISGHNKDLDAHLRTSEVSALINALTSTLEMMEGSLCSQ